MTHSSTARRIMLDFARRTGLSDSTRSPVRYLWTDAFAVCNLVGLFTEQADAQALDLARQLVDQTHHVLGRHRSDDVRVGWLSGLDDAEGEVHPTQAGLRIGKRWPERGPGEPEDPESEWDRDGQYFHYLTRWMHALDQLACATGEARLHRHAYELARAAHAGFVRTGASGERRLAWKMSIDLTRPQVAGMGLHDALDGFLTFSHLQAISDAWPMPGDDAAPSLHDAIGDLARMCAGRRWDTDDTLGVGGLLCDASRLVQLMARGALDEPALLHALLESAHRGVGSIVRRGALDADPSRRLAFRELGLSIGLHAVKRIRPSELGALDDASQSLLAELSKAEPLAERIESDWLDPRAQACGSWRDHLDINAVMLATSLAPGGYVDLRHPPDQGT